MKINIETLGIEQFCPECCEKLELAGVDGFSGIKFYCRKCHILSIISSEDIEKKGDSIWKKVKSSIYQIIMFTKRNRRIKI